MAKLWNCPISKHKGVRAPARMRKDDTRRYCLQCTETTGRLTERVCRALARKRTERKKQATNRKGRIKLDRTADGLDIQAEWERLCALSCFKDWGLREPSRTIGLQVFGGQSTLPSGHYAVETRRVHVTAGKAPGWRVSEVLLHELIHAAHVKRGLHRRGSRARNRYHDEAFHMMLLRAATEAYSLADAEVQEVRRRYREAGGARRAYSMDRALIGMLADRVERGAVRLAA